MAEKKEPTIINGKPHYEVDAVHFTEYDSKPALVLVASIGDQDHNSWLFLDALNNQNLSNLEVVKHLS